jgi:hypothetical protein
MKRETLEENLCDMRINNPAASRLNINNYEQAYSLGAIRRRAPHNISNI